MTVLYKRQVLAIPKVEHGAPDLVPPAGDHWRLHSITPLPGDQLRNYTWGPAWDAQTGKTIERMTGSYDSPHEARVLVVWAKYEMAEAEKDYE